MWQAVMGGPGLVCTTPQSLRARLDRLGGIGGLPPFSGAIFDEIDIFLTVDREERRDLWPVLEACLDSGTPVLGFTGTTLDEEGERAWTSRSFFTYEPEVPQGWLPLTRVRFSGVVEQEIVDKDELIDARLRAAYAAYEQAGGDRRSWRMIKLDALGGARSAEARQILGLHAERLLLYEGDHPHSAKLESLAPLTHSHSAIVLCRYIEAARRVADYVRERSVGVLQADGSMTRSEIERRSEALRAGVAKVLVITRDLGGRGLDFPSVNTAIALSPRANYQTVAQELARIRSRRENVKDATILFYAGTTEALKADRLAHHLVHDNTYRGNRLFEVEGVPPAGALPARETAHLAVEESLEL
jgi:Helicase conserved C-terminal domain